MTLNSISLCKNIETIASTVHRYFQNLTLHRSISNITNFCSPYYRIINVCTQHDSPISIQIRSYTTQHDVHNHDLITIH